MEEALATGPRLRELRWLETDTCCAVFEEEDGTRLETTFRIDRRGGITTGDDDAQVLSRVGGTAAQLRTVVAALASFCSAAQGESAE